MKVISWNLLRRSGAAVKDLTALVERERPDLLLLQEAMEPVKSLPDLIGGQVHHDLLPGRVHGLAVWTPHIVLAPDVLFLPVSRMPGRLPPRIAQIVRLDGVAFANVHLSHGQLLNRRQLYRIARSVHGPMAIVGDYNAVGPTVLPGFRDVGPRRVTHVASNVIPFRLDRCLARELDCFEARVLARGPSDHCPIMLDLRAALDAVQPLADGLQPTAMEEAPRRTIRSLRHSLLGRTPLPARRFARIRSGRTST